MADDDSGRDSVFHRRHRNHRSGDNLGACGGEFESCELAQLSTGSNYFRSPQLLSLNIKFIHGNEIVLSGLMESSPKAPLGVALSTTLNVQNLQSSKNSKSLWMDEP